MNSSQSEEDRIRGEVALLLQQLDAMVKKRIRGEKMEKVRAEIEASRPERPKEPRSVERVQYEYGEFELRIYGDPNRLFDIPMPTTHHSINQRLNRSVAAQTVQLPVDAVVAAAPHTMNCYVRNSSWYAAWLSIAI